jgi:hypothetical protein
MSSTHDFHFPDLCFEGVENNKYIILVVPEKEALYSEVTFSNIVAAHVWEMEDMFQLVKNPKKFRKNGDFIGFKKRTFYDIYYIKECMLSAVPEVEWEGGVMITHPDDFKVLYDIEEDCPVKVLCLRKTIPDLRRLNNEFRTSKL